MGWFIIFDSSCTFIAFFIIHIPLASLLCISFWNSYRNIYAVRNITLCINSIFWLGGDIRCGHWIKFYIYKNASSIFLFTACICIFLSGFCVCGIFLSFISISNLAVIEISCLIWFICSRSTGSFWGWNNAIHIIYCIIANPLIGKCSALYRCRYIYTQFVSSPVFPISISKVPWIFFT